MGGVRVGFEGTEGVAAITGRAAAATRSQSGGRTSLYASQRRRILGARDPTVAHRLKPGERDLMGADNKVSFWERMGMRVEFRITTA